MKLQIVSDLHLEFYPLEITNAGADALVLSGDICCAAYFKKSEASPYYVKAENAHAFFHQVGREFDTVFYVPGNHEHYSGKWEETSDLLRNVIPDNFIYLDNDWVDFNGYRIIGGTMWTDFDGGSPVAQALVEGGLNDYNYIKFRDRKLRGSKTALEHATFKRLVDDFATDNTLVFTHHGPSWQSVTPAYRTGRYSHLNAGYVSNLDNFILDHDGIKLWTHGHVHSSHDYMIGDTRIFANPRGYANATSTENPDFNASIIVTV